MTASWGGAGHIWGKDVCWCVVRPTRHTFELMERSAHFSLSFLDDSHRGALNFCGTKSGRDVPNKWVAAGLTPVMGPVAECTLFAEARLSIVCKKLYTQDIDPARFVDPVLDTFYPQKDYHRMYFGEIVSIQRKG